MKNTFGNLVLAFFTDDLVAMKGLSENTVASYSDCMRLLFDFTAKKLGTTVDKLNIEKIDDEIVLEFLDYLENVRENKAQTRNHRLTVIKTFFKFIASKVPTLICTCNKIDSIRQKKTEHKNILPMEEEELKAFFNAVNSNSNHGKRDCALFRLMYNTGARVQEIADIKKGDINFKPPFLIHITGKGNKDRTLCLHEKTVEAINDYINSERENINDDDFLFLNKFGNKFNRAGIYYLVKEYTKKAAVEIPAMLNKNISPHTFRHTVAFGIIESGNDITVVKDWFGHESITTAAMYVKISNQMKTEVLKKINPFKTDNPIEKKWRVPEIMNLLKKLSSKKEILC
jgi:integrase/recombinase XerD